MKDRIRGRVEELRRRLTGDRGRGLGKRARRLVRDVEVLAKEIASGAVRRWRTVRTNRPTAPPRG